MEYRDTRVSVTCPITKSTGTFDIDEADVERVCTSGVEEEDDVVLLLSRGYQMSYPMAVAVIDELQEIYSDEEEESDSI